MMIKNKLSLAVHAAIGVGAASALSFAGLANAQEEQLIEEVVITGSRIKRPDLEAVSPYITVSGEEFTLSGNFNVEQKLAELPINVEFVVGTMDGVPHAWVTFEHESAVHLMETTTKAATLFIGIDIHKRSWFYVSARSSQKEVGR